MSLLDAIFGSSNDNTNSNRNKLNTGSAQTSNNNKRESIDDTTTTTTTNDLFSTIIPIVPISYPTTTSLTKRKSLNNNNKNSMNKKQKSTSNQSTDNDDDDDVVEDGIMIGPKQQHQQADEKEEQDERQDNDDSHNNHNDDNDVNLRTIFVGNIPITYTRKHLRQLFIDCGMIESTRIRCIAIPGSNNNNTNDKNNKNKNPASSTDKANNKNKNNTTDPNQRVIKLPPELAGKQNIYKKVCINTNINHNHNTYTYTDTNGKKIITKQSNIGYVVFQKQESVDIALVKNNMIVPIQPIVVSSNSDTTTTTNSNGNIDVRHLRVDRVATSPISTTSIGNNNNQTDQQQQIRRDPKRTIFIGNLPYHTDEETLYNHILLHMKPKITNTSDSNHNNNNIIESIRIVRDKNTYLCQGFAYILFTSTLYIPIAFQTLHDTKYMNQVLRIQVCKHTTKNDQKMNTTIQQHQHDRRSMVRNTQSSSFNTSPSNQSKTLTKSPTTTSTTTKAVGALKRVLQKQQKLLSLQTTTGGSSNSNKTKKHIRKRGPITKSKTSKSKTKNVTKPKKANSKAKRN